MDNLLIQSSQFPDEQFPRDNGAGSLKDFIHLLHEIVPLLENVRNSIEESSHRIPKASKQLSKVTQETEDATVEILNVLEAMTARITNAETHLQRLKSIIQNSKDSAKRIAEKLLASSSEAGGYSSAELTTLVVNEFIAGIDGSEAIPSIEDVLRKTKEDSMNIAMALQVQDIASQQIASVAHTIESVETQLVRALNRFENGSAGDIANDNADETPAPARAFDVDARYGGSEERQDIADEIVKQFSNNK
jgi:chemotaxis regulatin CheY-phosphate phosphatase CheZ